MLGNRVQFLLASSLLILSLIVQVGCKDENSQEPPPKTALAPVTNLQAYSGPDSTVYLSWSASLDQTKNEYAEIQVNVKEGGSVYTAQTLGKNAVQTFVTNLRQGTIYTFEVVSKALSTSADFKDSDPAAISWAAARRYSLIQNSSEIRTYENGESGNKNGLVLFSAAEGGPKVVSVTAPGADSLLIDVFVDSLDNNTVRLKSASVYRASWRETRFAQDFREAESLDDPQKEPPDINTYFSGNTVKLIDNSPVLKSRIYYVKTSTNNYGRILVKRNSADGRLIWGSPPNRYLKLEISYQSRPGVPYVKPVLDGEQGRTTN